jgi:5-methylcytosine-specific restriction endonuclease McrA
MSARKDRLVLAIVATDSGFERREVRGQTVWVGKCIHCNAKLVVDEQGGTQATIEHILPRNHAGTDAVENLALACAGCNHEKGVRHDARKKDDPKLREIVERLAERRKARWRDPE